MNAKTLQLRLYPIIRVQKQQEAEQIKTPTLILAWWVFPEPQLTELTGETESITQNHL